MPNTNLFFQWVIMNSASEVGEIFTRAGDAYNKLGDMIMTLHPAGQELQALESNIDRREKEAREKQGLQQQSVSNGSTSILSNALLGSQTNHDGSH